MRGSCVCVCPVRTCRSVSVIRARDFPWLLHFRRCIRTRATVFCVRMNAGGRAPCQVEKMSLLAIVLEVLERPKTSLMALRLSQLILVTSLVFIAQFLLAAGACWRFRVRCAFAWVLVPLRAFVCVSS